MPSRSIQKPYKWTPILAYVVGLLTTDGNLSKDGRHLTMRSSDIDLLKTFNLCLKLDNKISRSVNDGYAKKPSYRVQFGNVRLYRWLLSVGLTPAKTLTIGKLKIPNQYFRDFLRGHLDGDGSIYTYTDKYNHYKGKIYINQRIYVVFISASYKHILWLHQKIKELSPVNGALLRRSSDSKKHTIWNIKFAKKESIKLLRWIYYKTDLPCLTRKKILAESVLEIVTKETRQKYSKII